MSKSQKHFIQFFRAKIVHFWPIAQFLAHPRVLNGQSQREKRLKSPNSFNFTKIIYWTLTHSDFTWNQFRAHKSSKKTSLKLRIKQWMISRLCKTYFCVHNAEVSIIQIFTWNEFRLCLTRISWKQRLYQTNKLQSKDIFIWQETYLKIVSRFFTLWPSKIDFT